MDIEAPQETTVAAAAAARLSPESTLLPASPEAVGSQPSRILGVLSHMQGPKARLGAAGSTECWGLFT